jgi:dTDP-4-amino-4,6-dideoxygalactose transaminase
LEKSYHREIQLQVKFVDLIAQYNELRPQIDSAIARVLESAIFIGGSEKTEFESSFSRYLGAKHCIGVGNGTDALYIALKSTGIGAGNEVIVPANTFIATAEAVEMTGAKVVFVDCCEHSYNLSLEDLKSKVTINTKAIIPVHLYGNPVDMEPLLDIARKNNIAIIEDAAQAHGAQINNIKVGTIGHAGCFSFFPGKNLGAYGDGGAIVTNSDELALKARMYANHGRNNKYDHEFVGVNSRLDSLQAAILNVKLEFLEKWTHRRRAIAEYYNEKLKNIVETPEASPKAKHVYHLYVIKVPNRDKVKMLLQEKEISTGIHYPIPLPFTKAYRFLNHQPDEFPLAYSLKDQILSLPIHGSMSDLEVEYTTLQLIDILKHNGA